MSTGAIVTSVGAGTFCFKSINALTFSKLIASSRLTTSFVKGFEHPGDGLKILEAPKLFFLDFLVFATHDCD